MACISCHVRQHCRPACGPVHVPVFCLQPFTAAYTDKFQTKSHEILLGTSKQRLFHPCRHLTLQQSVKSGPSKDRKCAPAACGGCGRSRARSPRRHCPQRATGAAAAHSRARRARRRPARGSWRCPAPIAAARTAATGTGAPASAGPPPAIAQPALKFHTV